MAITAQSSQFTEKFPIPRGHICAFFNGIDEERRVLHRFIKEVSISGIRLTISLTPSNAKNI